MAMNMAIWIKTEALGSVLTCLLAEYNGKNLA